MKREFAEVNTNNNDINSPSKPPPSKKQKTNLMTVYIHTLTRCIIPLSVQPTDTITTIEHKIQNVRGIPPEQQRIIFDKKPLCPFGTLADHNIPNDGILHLILRLGGGGIDAPDTLLTHVWTESFHLKHLNELFLTNNNDEWNINLTKIIFDYSPFIRFDVMRKLNFRNELCPRKFSSLSGRYYCEICNRWNYEKPSISHVLVNYLVSKHQKEKNMNKYIGYYYGLYIKFEFNKYECYHNKSAGFEIDIHSINRDNIKNYIQITDDVYGSELEYALYSVDKREANYYRNRIEQLSGITIKIDPAILNSDKIRKLFKNGKLKCHILIKEKELPTKYYDFVHSNLRSSKMGDIELEHYIYQI